MTPTEMKDYFLAEYDAATSLTAPGWEDSEISSFLNIAQDTIVTEFYKAGDLSKLNELIYTSPALSASAHPNGVANAVQVILDDIHSDGAKFFFYYLDSRSKVTRSDNGITDEYIPNELISRDDAAKFYLTTYNKLWLKYPKIYIENLDSSFTPHVTRTTNLTRFVVLVDAYTALPTRVEITFIKKPNRIDIFNDETSDLNESLHQLIVQLAVEQTIKSLKGAKLSNQ